MTARLSCAAALLIFLPAKDGRAQAPSNAPRFTEEGGGVRSTSQYLDVTFAADHPAVLSLAVDGLGTGRLQQNLMAADAAPPPSKYNVTRPTGTNSAAAMYRRSAGNPAVWALQAGGQGILATSQWSEERAIEPLTLTFDTHRCYATLLGLFLNDKGDVSLPAILHLPGFGTLRLSSDSEGAFVGYSSGKGWIKVTFPAADASHHRVEYRWDVAAIFPQVPGTEGDARYDGFRRNWLNIFQLNPNRLVLANNTNSDTCGFCYYEYADIAMRTPPLAKDLYALDMVRQTLERVFGGMKAYGMPGYGGGDFPVESSDTAPSLLIAALDYVEGRGDNAWLRAHYPALRAIADKMLATDSDGDGLVKYAAASGNSGTWNEGQPKVRPSNWWDTVGFGHEDAYSNALAYRALQGIGRMAGESGNPADAARYAAAAARLHDAYFNAFYDPATGVLAGWRSADGKVHDYGFTFVNGIAVLYGLVPPDRAARIMDRLWEEMRDAGYTNFRMGLPGNLVPVARRDYAHLNPRYGGGLREDNADGFQVYENGGATACFSYFTIAAYDLVGQHGRAARILLPILGAFDAREFEGVGSNGLTNDWRKWDGTAEGYEGFLTDNYYALLAVPGP